MAGKPGVAKNGNLNMTERAGEFVTFRELVDREEKMISRVETLLNKHFTLFEKDINNRFIGYGHEIADQLSEMRTSIVSELRNQPDGPPSQNADIKSGLSSALTGKAGAGAWVLAAAIVALIAVLMAINPNMRHLLPFF